MTAIERIGLTGAVAVAVGLCLGGPAGVAVAEVDGGSGQSAATSADTSARPARTPGRGGASGRPPGIAAGARPDRAAAPAPTRATPTLDPVPADTDVDTESESWLPTGVDAPAAPAPASPASPASPAPRDFALRPSTTVNERVANAIPNEAVTAVQPVVPEPAATSLHAPVAATAADLNGLGPLPFGLNDRGPALPADSPLSWTMLAAASRETFAAGGTVAIPQTPLLTALGLQEVPILGPLLVTPMVTVINAIPMVSDLLHPLVGYPLLPAGQVAPRDVRVVSFDGTEINVHLMPAAGLRDGQNAPTILMASALGMPGATNLNGTPLDALLGDLGGEVGIATLRDAGYNVVTWDPRGEYASGGVFEIDSPYFEARDVSAIMNWLAEQPQVQLDGPGDPRIGMVGASYGGGIQPVAAAVDHRIDAIVPTIGWNTLNSMIYPNGAFKTASGAALAATLVFTLAQANPRILPAVIHGNLTGEMSPQDQDLLAARGPGSVRGFPDMVGQITAPTLLIQGTVDTLTGLNQADLTARTLLANGVPTKVLWFCGGHGVCINPLFDPSEGALIQQRTLEWLDRYVKREAVSTGPGFEWVDQRGQRLSVDTYGSGAGAPIVASRSGTDVLPLIPFVAGSGPMFLVLPFGGTKAFNAINLVTPAPDVTTYVVGAPQLTVRYSGTGSGTHVYAQLLDTTTGLVLGNQVTPIPVTLDGQPHTVSIPLQPVAHTMQPGQTVSLQLFAWAAEYAGKPSLGQFAVSDISISLPTVSSPTVSSR
jgi:ABC-2 type transport system ATP-binding protein